MSDTTITLVSNDGAQVVVGKEPRHAPVKETPKLTANNRESCRRALHAHQEHDGGSWGGCLEHSSPHP